MQRLYVTNCDKQWYVAIFIKKRRLQPRSHYHEGITVVQKNPENVCMRHALTMYYLASLLYTACTAVRHSVLEREMCQP